MKNNLSQEDKLKVIIQKAMRNGWKHMGMRMALYDKVLKYTEIEWNTLYESEGYFALIFSHDFAKAFWKNTNHLGEIGKGNDFDNGWLFHLKELAITPEPERIDYLYKFI
jgi:hypothetical protein